jgi:hypothetical protein
MPAFIKPHHVQQQFFDRQNSNSSTSTGYQNQPQYQARSGFPGQNLSNVPSPVDRVNSARNIHLKRHTSENYRRESPGRYSPNRQVVYSSNALVNYTRKAVIFIFVNVQSTQRAPLIFGKRFIFSYHVEGTANQSPHYFHAFSGAL